MILAEMLEYTGIMLLLALAIAYLTEGCRESKVIKAGKKSWDIFVAVVLLAALFSIRLMGNL